MSLVNTKNRCHSLIRLQMKRTNRTEKRASETLLPFTLNPQNGSCMLRHTAEPSLLEKLPQQDCESDVAPLSRHQPNETSIRSEKGYTKKRVN